jgi:hypothetical protein
MAGSGRARRVQSTRDSDGAREDGHQMWILGNGFVNFNLLVLRLGIGSDTDSAQVDDGSATVVVAVNDIPSL